MDGPHHETVRTGIVYCSNVHDLISHVCIARGLDRGSVSIKIGVDTGKGFLKVTLSIYTWPIAIEDECASYSGSLKAMVLATCQAIETEGNQRTFFQLLPLDTPLDM